jgi:hypothetical protein
LSKLGNYRKLPNLFGSNINILYYDANLFLERAIKDLRTRKDGSLDDEFRIVVFIDDLDRCAPEKALEVLESIKTFFDIEGFVFVAGINQKTIDTLTNKKYHDNPHIAGSEYVRKIFQLQFAIPDFREVDIAAFFRKAIIAHLEKELMVEFDHLLAILTMSVELNPREIKRFINKIILVKEIYNKPLEGILVVSALQSKPEWNKFLELITPDEQRREFLNAFEKMKHDVGDGKRNILNLFPDFDAFYPGFFDQGNSLRRFLDSGAAYILEKMDHAEEYRRALITIEKIQY